MIPRALQSCGLGTDDEALAGTLDPDGVTYCYDPVSSSKGTHACPYAAFVWAYDALDLADVAAGTTIAAASPPARPQ